MSEGVIENYGELLEAIAEELDRDDLQHRIPQWVGFAEMALYRYLSAADGEQFETAEFVIDQEFITFPAGLKRARFIEIQTNPLRVLSLVDPTKRADVLVNDVTGLPRVYFIHGLQAFLAPVPQTAETYKLFYYGQPPLLSSTNEVTDLLLRAPEVLMYEALKYSAPYLQDDERINTWATVNNEPRRLLRKEYWNLKVDGGIKRTRPDFAPGDSHDVGAVLS